MAIYSLLPTHRQPERMRSWCSSFQTTHLTGRHYARWIAGGVTFIGVLWFIVLPSLFGRGKYMGPPFHDLGPPPPPPAQHHPVLPESPPEVEIDYPPPHPPQSAPNSARSDAVRDAFLHAYNGYTRYAWGFDELRPKSGGKANTFNGWSITLLDALDSLWIMDLHDQFYEAIPAVANITFLTEDKFAPFFETVIRALGGLLSAYALSGEPILLTRADDLGKALLPVFNTNSGLPMYAVNTATGATRPGWNVDAFFAEMASCQLEYKYLAHLTGRTDYFTRVDHVIDIMYKLSPTTDLYPTQWSIKQGKPANNVLSVGAAADSGYEYLLKQYLLTARSEPRVREMYLKSVRAIIENLFFLSPNRKLLYVTDMNRGTVSRTFEHLSCFLPGLLVLGTKMIDMPPSDRELHEWAAQGLAYTCYVSYADQPSGLGPDEMVMDPWTINDGSSGQWISHVKAWIEEGKPGGVPPGLHEPAPAKDGSAQDYRIKKTDYLLRPEVVESLYLMWRTTGDERWRERGWEIFQSIEKHAWTVYGYASLRGVDRETPAKLDEMPSYFLAETLKYLYLLFVEEDIIPLDRWVFNTEAHPLPVFEWSQWEKVQYKIPL
ncbi:glycoside hydrolase family 47 protein [Pisolithus orientalis]|uniref:glycoside hydrolase family 47 protein n=1 Tax=Pisolithus orientalis TaxID=936130 RepID=UPI0022254101|nr:glycoside hydrolase family 47 protein [Pisolithus orientalis]KAI6010684.1 glycoside hydrolase family 47 protein [Pisolithus orientalis]